MKGEKTALCVQYHNEDVRCSEPKPTLGITVLSNQSVEEHLVSKPVFDSGELMSSIHVRTTLTHASVSVRYGCRRVESSPSAVVQ